MRPGGLASLEAACADGRWAAAYAPQSAGEVPPDLRAALAAVPEAAAVFRQLSRAEQYDLVLPLLKARSAEARSRHVAAAVDRLRPD